jgi:hypothetical protein
MRNIVLLSGLLAVALASPARAQDVDVTALQMKACTSIRDAAARASCYDKAMSVPASQSEPAMVGIGSNAPLVTIPQSPATIPQAPAAAPQPMVTPQVTATAPPSSPEPVEAPAPAKPESTSVLDVNSIMKSITPSGIGTLTQPGANEAQKWEVKANNASIEQASRLVGTLKSADGKASLVLQCKDGGTLAYVSTDFYLGVDTVRVSYRAGGNAVPESRWSIATDGRSAIAGNAIEFVNALAEGGMLEMRLIDYNDVSHDVGFNTGAISNLRTQLGIVCRWPGATPVAQVAAEQAPPSPRAAKSKPATKKPIGPPLQLR